MGQGDHPSPPAADALRLARVSENMRRYVVLNSKGGCGKTTVATNLASLLAAGGMRVALYDYDPQGSSMRWFGLRGELFSPLQCINAQSGHSGVTRSFQLRVPPGTECAIVDTPASLRRLELEDLLRGADAVLVPVLPSAIDLHVSGDFLAGLGDILRQRGRQLPVGLVANRARRNTRAYAELQQAVIGWRRPLIATLRDTMYYPQAASAGLGIHELPGGATRIDRADWQAIRGWLESGRVAPALDLGTQPAALLAG